MIELWIYNSVDFKSRRKIVHPFAALTREIFFNTRRELSYLEAAMSCSDFLYNTNEMQNHFTF